MIISTEEANQARSYAEVVPQATTAEAEEDVGEACGGDDRKLTHEDLRKWGESLDKESRNSLGKRLILYADHWRAEVTAEREACAKQCEMRADSLTEGYGVAHQCARDIRARGAK